MQGIESYFRELERCLDCPRRIRKPFLDKTRQMAKDFLQGKPDAALWEIADYLGEPKELAQGFLETLDAELLERYRKRRRFLLYGCIAVLTVAFVTMAAWALHIRSLPQRVEVTGVITIHDR